MSDSNTINTFKAHRFIHFAASQHLQGAAKERLLRAYFTENLDLDNNETLMRLGAELGLDTAQLAQALSEDSYTENVKADIAEAQMLGVKGVPFFAFDRKYGVSGAQSSEVFLQHLQKSFAEWQTKNKVTPLETLEGQVCSTDGKCD